LPVRRMRRRGGAIDRCRSIRVASHEVGVGCGVFFAERCGAYRVRPPAERELFPRPLRCFDRPSTGSVSQAGFILPCRSSSSEFLHHGARPTLRSDTTCPGFLPSSRRHREASTGDEGSHTPASRSALRLSQPLDGLLRSRLASLFHPAATYRVFPVQGFLPTRSHPLSSRGAPSLPLSVSRSPAYLAVSGCHTPRTQLRGLAPRIDALLRFDCSPSLRSLPSSVFFFLQVLPWHAVGLSTLHP
jgi:hypothetical protein